MTDTDRYVLAVNAYAEVERIKARCSIAEAVALDALVCGCKSIPSLLTDLTAANVRADEAAAMCRWLAGQAAMGAWDELACRPEHRRPPGYAPVILPDTDGLTMPERWLAAAREAVKR